MAPKKDSKTSKPVAPKAKAKAKAKAKSTVKTVSNKGGKAKVEEITFKAKKVGKVFYVTIGEEVIEKPYSTDEEKVTIEAAIKKAKDKPTNANFEGLKKVLKPETIKEEAESVKKIAGVKKSIRQKEEKAAAKDKDVKELTSDLKAKLEKGEASETEINELQALINKHKKVEEKKEAPKPAASPYRGER